MLLSDLPREIIEKITELLSLEDKISCSRVSKSWEDIFQDSLHFDLLIDSYSLNSLVNPTQDDQPPCLKNRLLVRNLDIRCFTKVTDERLYILQQTFPNIKYLLIESGAMFPENFGVTADWNIWRLLTELYISLDQKPVPDITKKLMKTILCLPLLRRLEISASYVSDIRASFTLDDFETIHSHLKHLGHLSLHSNLLTLSETDIERMTNVSPATNMGSLWIASENTDHRWLCYFARKYPNLHTLGFSVSNILPEIDEKRSDTIALFQQVPLPFQSLTTLNFEYCDWVGKNHLLFWDIIQFPNMPLKHLMVSVNLPMYVASPDNPCHIPRHIAEVCLTGFSNTIETFNLECSFDLRIVSSAFVEIDILLCAAPRLKSLAVDRSCIIIKDELYNSNRFGLQKFIVYRTHITSDALRFLSFHCRSLNQLNLSSSSIYGSFTIPGCQFIDMSYTKLKILYMKNTIFIIQDNNDCPENLDITLITRPIDDVPPKQDYDPNVLPVVVGGLPTKSYYDWFHTNFNQEMWHISSEQGSRVETFVLNYEENKIITSKSDLDESEGDPDVICDSNCVFGYTKLKLGYVAKFLIEFSKKDEESCICS